MRYAPVMVGPVPHSAGQPVVTVYEVVSDAFALSDYFQVSKKISEIRIDPQFIHRSFGTGLEMDKTYIFIQIQSLLASGIAEASENIDQMASSSQLSGKLTGANTHATGVIRPQFAYGTGMNAEHCDS
jgi:hypothetical protein